MKKDKEKKRLHVNKRAAAGAIIIAAAIAAASACVRVRPSSGTGASAYETTASETAPSAESLEGKGETGSGNQRTGTPERLIHYDQPGRIVYGRKPGVRIFKTAGNFRKDRPGVRFGVLCQLLL